MDIVYINDVWYGYLVIGDVFSCIVMFLSFPFSHYWYEKRYLCGYCDNKAKAYWENKAKNIHLDARNINNSGCSCSCCCNVKSLIVEKEIVIRDEKEKRLLDDYTDHYNDKTYGLQQDISRDEDL